tara:strand:- start:19 stop:294 length:276 start_codon:yes stop_codon:yes gene_type:complete
MDKFNRKCDGCGNGMNEGYLLFGDAYACSDKCGKKCIGLKDWKEGMQMWDEEGDCEFLFWTEWYEHDIPDTVESYGGYFDNKGRLVEEAQC